MKDNNNNLEETKVFKSLKNEKETNNDFDDLDIPFVKKAAKNPETNTEDTRVLSKKEIMDEDKKNIQAAEDELNQVLQSQNGNGGDGMAKKDNSKKLSRLGKFNIFLLSLVFFMFIGFIGAGYIWAKLSFGTPDLDVTTLVNQKTTVLKDINDEEFFDLGMYGPDGTTSEDLSYINMSQNIVDAFVSIEDSRFFQHNGFDVPRFTKAIIENVKAKGFAQGGSTLTMQLIKTSHLSSKKAISRKAQEINLSFALEKELEKDEIFEFYVNKINYGAGNTRGLEGASIYYFNKSASDLSLSESALLAGVINRPNTYSPVDNLDNAYKRRGKVLDLMVYHGYIDEDEANLAKSVKIENQLTDEGIAELTIKDNPYIDYVNAVIDEVQARLDIDIVSTPLTIYTNMDPEIQKDIAAIQNSDGYQYPDEYMQSAVAIGDNETGALLGLGAGRDSQVVKGRNRATRMFQQPGSVTKPLLSYSLAFEHLGWSTSHVVEDKPVQYAGTDIMLGNFDGRYRGEMTLKEAVARSINTPAYLTLLEVEQKISRGAVADYLHDSLGFTKVNRENYNTQYAIGGSTFSVSPAELFGAQAVMMNGGYYTKPHTVRYVETSDKEIIKDEFDYPRTKVLSEETAYLVSVLEENNVSSGVINRMEVLGGRPYKVYAKTGTTDYGDTAVHLGIPEGAGKDQWMFASSKAYTSVVWMGWDKPEAGKGTYWSGYKYTSNPLGKMNIRLLNTIHKDKENPGNVVRPDGVTSIQHVLSTFPYANPIEGMDSAYIATGEINRKFLNLVDLKNQQVNIEGVSEFDATLKRGLIKDNIKMSWSEYPDDGSIKSQTYDISAGSIKATGTRLFHPSWIFGPVRYKATVYVDNKIVENIETDSNSYELSINNPLNKTVKICGFYANSQQSGPETCITMDSSTIESDINVPALNTIDDVNEFISNINISSANWKIGDTTETNNKDLDGKIASITSNGNSIINKNFSIEALEKMEVIISYYEYKEVEEEKPEVDESDKDKDKDDKKDD